MTSPIGRMIDAACGAEEASAAPAPRQPASEVQKSLAKGIALSAINHINDMYPGMWEGVPVTARTSLRNHISNQIVDMLTDPEGECMQPDETPRSQPQPSLDSFMDALRATNVVDEEAVYSPEEFDGYVTFERMVSAYNQLFPKENNQEGASAMPAGSASRDTRTD